MNDEGKLSEQESYELLGKAPVGYLALSKDNRPYVIPINFVYCDDVLYFHCASRGKKIDYIKANPQACFQTGETGALVKGDDPCSHNYSYRSVIVDGVVEEVCSFKTKEYALRKITAKYTDSAMAGAPISSKRLEAVAVYRLVPESISGKRDS